MEEIEGMCDSSRGEVEKVDDMSESPIDEAKDDDW